MPIRIDNVKHILVVRNDRFGEFLLNIPALRALKETYPAAKITAVVDPYVAELAGHVPFIDEIITWGGLGHSFWARLRLVGLLRKKKYAIAVMLNPSKEFNIITILAGIPVRAGYNRKCGFLLTHKLADTKHLGLKHEVEYNLELVGLLGAATDNLGLSLSIEGGIINDFLAEFKVRDQDKLIALHPWTSDPVKDWPHFRQLAAFLASEPGIRLVIVGANKAGVDAGGFAGLGEHVINFTGRTSLVQLAALLARCRLLISCDSGPVHLSCCVGTPVVVLFSSSLPAKSARRWGPWGESNTVIAKSKLSDISADEVMARVREKL